MPDYIHFIEVAKQIGLFAGLWETGKTLLNEAGKAIISEGVKKLFEKKPEVKALASPQALPSASEDEKVEALAQHLNEAAKKDPETGQMLQLLGQTIQKHTKHEEEISKLEKSGLQSLEAILVKKEFFYAAQLAKDDNNFKAFIEKEEATAQLKEVRARLSQP